MNGNGLAYDGSTGDFVFSAFFPPDEGTDSGGLAELFRVTTGKVASSVGPMDEYAGGMAFSNIVPVELQTFTVE